MKSGIYKIENKENSKVYIGSASWVFQRWGEHRYRLRGGFHANAHLQNAWIKYGESSFDFKLIEPCVCDKLTTQEQYYMDLYNSYDREYGYNILKLANTTFGYKHTEEAKRKISISGFGKDTGRRDYEKWPHDKGNRCGCNECREKKRLYYQAYDEVRNNV